MVHHFSFLLLLLEQPRKLFFLLMGILVIDLKNPPSSLLTIFYFILFCRRGCKLRKKSWKLGSILVVVPLVWYSKLCGKNQMAIQLLLLLKRYTTSHSIFINTLPTTIASHPSHNTTTNTTPPHHHKYHTTTPSQSPHHPAPSPHTITTPSPHTITTHHHHTPSPHHHHPTNAHDIKNRFRLHLINILLGKQFLTFATN
jgi:hypothetical protein